MIFKNGLEVIYIIFSIVCRCIVFLVIVIETAYINLTKLGIEHLIPTNIRHAKIVEGKNDMEGLLSKTSLFAAVVGTIVANLGNALSVLVFGEAVDNPVNTVAIGLLIFVFAMIIPKLVAIKHPD